MARKVTIAKFAEWIAEQEHEEEVLDLVAGGLTLQKAALVVKQPYTCLHGYFHDGGERQARYEGARKAWADAVMDEALRISDGVKPNRDAVAKAKLQVETRLSQARAYHRERWGERLQVEKSVAIGIDQELLGRADELLRLANERVVGAGEVPVALPAPVGEKV